MLRAFVGKALTLDELIKAFGLFGFEWRSALLNELTLLRRSGYLKVNSHRYSLPEEMEKQFLEAGEPVVDLVKPRDYSPLTAPPLKLSRLHDPSMRRQSTINVTVQKHFIASDPIPFRDDE